MKRAKIKECLPIVDGLWSKIDYQLPQIFDLTPSQLDVIFLSNWAERFTAPIINVVRETTHDGETLSSAELTKLADIIKGMYSHKWDKNFAVAVAEYDPLHNYYDELNEHVSYGEEKAGSKTSTTSDSNTRTDNLSEVKTDARQVLGTRNLANSGTDSSQEGVYAFNSSTAVGDRNSSGSNSGSETGTITTANSGSITTGNTGTQTNVGSNTYSESDGNETLGERFREYTKTGNIGNISTQKLMNEELDLWKYNFILEMMRDVVEFITLPFYETEKI